MSMMMMVKAFGLKVGSAPRKLVLLKLADNANDQGECWPSYKHIADQCEISKRSAMQHITELCKAGYVTKQWRSGPKGNSSNMYRLNLDIAQPSESCSPPSESCSPPLVNILHPEPVSIEPVSEPKPCANALRDAFDEFWQSVPNKKDKARARRFFEREAKKYGDPTAFADMLIDDMRARLESGQQGFDLIHPSTYLNNRRWEDERPLACPHKKIVKLWNETLPDHIEKVTPDDWTPRHPGFAVLAQSWEVFKTKPRATTGKPVFDTEDRGLEFYRETFKRLAKTHYANREGSERFITLRWAAEQHNTTKIFKGEIQ